MLIGLLAWGGLVAFFCFVCWAVSWSGVVEHMIMRSGGLSGWLEGFEVEMVAREWRVEGGAREDGQGKTAGSNGRLGAWSVGADEGFLWKDYPVCGRWWGIWMADCSVHGYLVKGSGSRLPGLWVLMANSGSRLPGLWALMKDSYERLPGLWELVEDFHGRLPG